MVHDKRVMHSQMCVQAYLARGHERLERKPEAETDYSVPYGQKGCKIWGEDEMGSYASRYMNDLNHASSDSFPKMPMTPPMSGSPDMPT